MQLYESNYLRLNDLCADLAHLPDQQCSSLPGQCDLKLNVKERAVFTLTLGLTHQFQALNVPAAAAESPLLTYPNVQLRVYTDARLVEAQGYDLPEGQRAGPADRELGQRWAANMMLNKWLEYCRELGHRF